MDVIIVSNTLVENIAVKMLYYLEKLFWIHTWIYFWTPTKDFLRASNEEEYNIFFLTLAVSGHQDIRNNFCFFEAYNSINLISLTFNILKYILFCTTQQNNF